MEHAEQVGIGRGRPMKRRRRMRAYRWPDGDRERKTEKKGADFGNEGGPVEDNGMAIRDRDWVL